MVGTTGTISWGNQQRTPTQAQRNAGDNGTIVVRNDSGCGLAISFNNSDSTTYMSAGEWASIALDLTDSAFTFVVDYVLSNPPVSRLIVVYFQPGQTVDVPSALGNSPIGLSGSVQTSVTQVIQDNQTRGLIIMESTPLTGGQSVLVTTDGIAEFVGGVRYGPSVGGNFPFIFYNTGNHEVEIVSPPSGAANGILFGTWDGAVQRFPFGIGATGVASIASIDQLGNITVTKLNLIGTPGNAGIDWEGNLVVYRTPEAGATAQAHVFQVWNGSAAPNPFSVGSSDTFGQTRVGNGGAFEKIAAQATAGSFGVPVIVAQALDVAVAVTTLQTILDLVAPATGLYEISFYFELNNGTSPQKIVGQVVFTDPDLGVQVFSSFVNDGAIVLNGANNIANGGHPCATYPIYAKTGTHIQVQYQDPLATPNDHVTTMIKRLA